MNSFFIALFLLLANPLPGFDRELWTAFPNMNSVTALAEGSQYIYVGTERGIRRYDIYGERWHRPLTVLDGLPDNRIRAIAYDANTGELWMDTPSGAARWLTRLESVSYFGDDPPPRRPPAPIPPVYLPFGYFIESGWIRGPRRSYPITATLMDTWHTLWIGTGGLGIAKAKMTDRQVEFHAFGPLDENVTAMARDGDSIWFGGRGVYGIREQAISRYHLETQLWEYFEPEHIMGLDEARISAILPDSATVWFGAWNGLIRYVRHSGQWTTYRLPGRREVTALARAGSRVWIGTQAGLAVFDTQADTIRWVGGSERFTIHAMAAGAGYIWAGTHLGLFRCPVDDVNWTPVRSPGGLTSRPINGLATSRNHVWATVESPSALIHVAAPDSAWQRFALAEIHGDRHVSIAADTSHVWLATDLGAFRFDISTKLWKRYTQSSGLIDDRTQAVLLQDDYVWFGTEKGASRYDWSQDFFR